MRQSLFVFVSLQHRGRVGGKGKGIGRRCTVTGKGNEMRGKSRQLIVIIVNMSSISCRSLIRQLNQKARKSGKKDVSAADATRQSPRQDKQRRQTSLSGWQYTKLDEKTFAGITILSSAIDWVSSSSSSRRSRRRDHRSVGKRRCRLHACLSIPDLDGVRGLAGVLHSHTRT